MVMTLGPRVSAHCVTKVGLSSSDGLCLAPLSASLERHRDLRGSTFWIPRHWFLDALQPVGETLFTPLWIMTGASDSF